MKILTALVLCLSIFCVKGYTIFPLPGQSVEANPKFSNFQHQTPKTPGLSSRLGSLEPRPFQSQSTRTPEVNIGHFARPISTQTVVPIPQRSKSVEILNVSGASKTKILTPSGFVQNTQNFVPSRQNAGVQQPAKDVLPPKEDPKPVVATTSTTSPTNTFRPKPAVEVPFNDLLPPKTK